MAIDRLNKVTIAIPAKDSRWFLSQLYQLNAVHIMDTFSHIDDSSISCFQRFPTVIEEIEKNIQKLNTIFSILKIFSQKKKGFVEGIFPIPLQVTKKELDQTFSRIDIESIHKECQVQYEKYSAFKKQHKQRKEEIDKLTDFLPLADELTRIGSIRNASFFYCKVSASRWNRFLKDEQSSEFLAWQIVSKTDEKLKILLVYLNSDKDVALKIIAKFDLKEMPFPVLPGNIKDHFDALVSEMTNLAREERLICQRFIELSHEWRSLEILLGYWENERNKMIAQRSGALTGGWAGDLYNPMYLGEDNLLLKAKERLMLLDPLSKPVIALLIAIGLGVLNQFYGITLRMYGEILRKNILNAICDGLLWLIMLPGVLILISTIFLKAPGYLVSIGKYLAIVGAAGLISTQGRNEKGIAGKIFTGIVSLYGIVGTYGCSGFIGDILSYTRILALSLTTTIIGMAFNIVASLFKTGTFIGMVLFIITLVTGHMFNFVMSILGAFIHPARLIFLEFFGRFYEGGATKFQPYGFGNQRIVLEE